MFDAFCTAEHPRLVGLLALHVGDRLVAEELAQDALVRLQEQWPKVRLMASPHAWLCRVGVNLANSWWRRRYAERRAMALSASGQRSAGSDDAADVVAIRTAVAALPRRQRTALTLRYFAGLSVTETAADMRCAEGTVKSLCSQAIAGLRLEFLDPVDPVDLPVSEVPRA